jgi:hypothetical protein
MKVARGALLNLPLPLGEGRGEGNGHGERRLSSCGVALVAMAVSRDPAPLALHKVALSTRSKSWAPGSRCRG